MDSGIDNETILEIVNIGRAYALYNQLKKQLSANNTEMMNFIESKLQNEPQIKSIMNGLLHSQLVQYMGSVSYKKKKKNQPRQIPTIDTDEDDDDECVLIKEFIGHVLALYGVSFKKIESIFDEFSGWTTDEFIEDILPDIDQTNADVRERNEIYKRVLWPTVQDEMSQNLYDEMVNCIITYFDLVYQQSDSSQEFGDKLQNVIEIIKARPIQTVQTPHRREQSYVLLSITVQGCIFTYILMHLDKASKKKKKKNHQKKQNGMELII